MSAGLTFLHAREIVQLPVSQRWAYAEEAFVYWRQRGFPFPEYKDADVCRAYTSFANSETPVLRRDRSIAWSPLGLGLANSFHPHMWSTKCERFRTPMAVFRDDAMLQDSLWRAIKFWRRGRPMSASGLRSSVSTYKNTKRVSNFRPTAARAIYERYSSPGDLIVDPAAGYGGRLLGCLPLNRHYVGIEPCKSTYHGLDQMLARLGRLNPVKASVELLCEPGESALLPLAAESAALVILSPPYFARERYDADETQSWVQYPSYREWKSDFLEVMLCQVHRILKPGGYLALNVANTESHAVAEDARSIARRYFSFHFSYRLLVGSVPYHRNGQCGGYRSEPLYIFRKRAR